MHPVAVLLALATSALAFQVTEPTNATGWTDSGPQFVSWTTVSTDPKNFTIAINKDNNPNTDQTLVALVDGSLGNYSVNPPSGGWKAGTAYRVVFAQDEDHLQSILAESDMFTIRASTSSNTSTSSGSQSSNTLVIPPSTTGNVASTADTTGAASSSPSNTSTTPTNGASPLDMHTGLIAGLFLLLASLA